MTAKHLKSIWISIQIIKSIYHQLTVHNNILLHNPNKSECSTRFTFTQIKETKNDLVNLRPTLIQIHASF